MSVRARRGYRSVYSLFFSLTLSLLLASTGCGGTSSGLGTPGKTLTAIAASPATANVSIGGTKQFSATATYSDGSTFDVTAAATWSDANAKVATITSSGMATALAAGSTTITATMDGVSGSATLTVPAVAKTLTSIAVAPSTATIAAGATRQFAATATYSDNSTAEVTTSATWTSSNPAIAKISPSGLASAVAAGSATITATVDGVAGSATVTVPVPAKTLTSLAVRPPTASVVTGATQQFVATATFSDSSTANVTTSVTWTSSNAAVATVTPAGLASALTAGSATITATLNGVTGSSSLTVQAPVPTKTLTSIAVAPPTASIAAKSTQPFTATATYSDNSTADVTATATWTSSNPAVTTVAAGLATGVAAGSAAITATLTGVHGAATLTVTPSLTAVSVTPNPASITAGATQQFTATATYSDGSTHDVTATAQWSAGNTAVATINAAGLATAVASGSTAVTASFGGMSGTATLNVKALTSISISPGTATFSAGSTQQFAATANYSDGTTQNITTTAQWSVTNSVVATINASGLATGVASGSTNVTATLGTTSGTATLTITAVPVISVTPDPSTVALGSTQQFTATITNPDGTTSDVTSTATWSVANTAVATVSSTGLVTGVASGSTTITASFNGTKGACPLTITLAAAQGVNVTTWHFDNNRSGLNPNETSLTPTNVAPLTFGKLFSYLVDGYAYAEPLLMSNVTINGAAHNVLYVATENDSVYAFDADTYGTGTPLWKISLLQAGESPIGGPIQPYEGVTSTPVIDPTTGTLYVVSVQKPSGGTASFRLNALDITTGAHKFGSPMTITASVPGTNSNSVGGTLTLPTSCIQRAALLLANGTIYMGFGSCYSGWLLSYDAQTLAQTGVFNASPNIDGEGTYGGAGGIWMGSGGPVADSAGNIYVSTGNGPWDTTKGSYGDSVLKFSPSLQLLDYFTPQDYQFMNCNDSDLAAGGLLMIPGSGQIIGGGKMGRLYLLNTANLGQEQTGDPGAKTVYVEQGLISPYTSAVCTDNIPAPNTPHTAMINSYEIFGTSAWFNGSVYIGVTPTSPTAPAGVRRFTYASTGLTPQEFTAPNIQQNTRGTTPFISANGTTDGILWMIDEGQPIQSPSPTNATLRAYDAANLSNELYDSSTNSADVPGYGIKFTSPIVANGKVYISTGHDLLTVANPQGEIDVYGLK